MSLYWSEPPDRPPGPRLHALVIGVGSYPHFDGPPALRTVLPIALRSLTTTLFAAEKIIRWLESEYCNPACPLGSIEVLLSSPAKLTREDGSAVDFTSLRPLDGGPSVSIEPATAGAVEAAALRWFHRCHTAPENTAFFYFAGHGISALGQQFLLPSDFGDPAGVSGWENIINFTRFQPGMYKCAAKTQIYFVDACREPSPPVAQMVGLTGRDLVGPSQMTDFGPYAAIYYAAGLGQLAYGAPGRESYFCEALILCLGGLAIGGAGALRENGRWQISTASLGAALTAVVEAIGRREAAPLTSESNVSNHKTFHYPPSGAVVVAVRCEPKPASLASAIRVVAGPEVVNSPVGERRPWMRRFSAGPVRIEITFINPVYPSVIDDNPYLAQAVYNVEAPR